MQEAHRTRSVTPKGKRNESPELKVLSADTTENREEVARPTAWKRHEEFCKIKRVYEDVTVNEEAAGSTSKPNFGRRTGCTLSTVVILYIHMIWESHRLDQRKRRPSESQGATRKDRPQAVAFVLQSWVTPPRGHQAQI